MPVHYALPPIAMRAICANNWIPQTIIQGQNILNSLGHRRTKHTIASLFHQRKAPLWLLLTSLWSG